MLQAIDHLVALGHKSFGVISGPLHIGIGRPQLGMPSYIVLPSRGCAAEHVVECNYRVDGGMLRSGMLNQNALPSALLAHDLIAIGPSAALQEARIRVPEDVSVVGVDTFYSHA